MTSIYGKDVRLLAPRAAGCEVNNACEAMRCFDAAAFQDRRRKVSGCSLTYVNCRLQPHAIGPHMINYQQLDTSNEGKQLG